MGPIDPNRRTHLHVRHFLDVVGRMMHYEAMELDGSDGWRLDETWDLTKLQREYRETTEAFRAWLVGLRKQLRGLIGDDETRNLLELQGWTPRSQEELADYADWLYHRMAIWELPRLRYRAAASHKVWRRQLQPMVEKLGELDRRSPYATCSSSLSRRCDPASTSTWSEPPWESMVTTTGNFSTSSTHRASGTPNSSSMKTRSTVFTASANTWAAPPTAWR